MDRGINLENCVLQTLIEIYLCCLIETCDRDLYNIINNENSDKWYGALKTGQWLGCTGWSLGPASLVLLLQLLIATREMYSFSVSHRNKQPAGGMYCVWLWFFATYWLTIFLNSELSHESLELIHSRHHLWSFFEPIIPLPHSQTCVPPGELNGGRGMGSKCGCEMLLNTNGCRRVRFKVRIGLILLVSKYEITDFCLSC